MSCRIGLVSDVHCSPRPLREALELFRREGVDEIICAGDIAGYFDTLAPTIELLVEYDCKTIAGNHDQSFLDKAGDDTFEFRLALGLARSFATSTRFILDKSLAQAMYMRSRYLIERVLETDPRKAAHFRLPIEDIFVD